jgi:hypothetical protein
MDSPQDSPLASFFSSLDAYPEGCGEDLYDILDTGLGGDFDFNSPLEASSTSRPAPTGIDAITAHGNDLTIFLDSEEARLSAVPVSTYCDLVRDPWWVEYWSSVSAESQEEEGLGHEPEACHSEEEVSEEETESEDEIRPSQTAMKKPVGALSPAGSGHGEEERASSEDIPIADTPEEQEEEEDEDDDDDDEYAPGAASARPVRRVAGGQQPARISVAPTPVIGSRRATSWSAAEDAACTRLMKEVCTQPQYAAIARTEKRFEVVADRMQREAGFVRTGASVKMQWNRALREASKFEDRGEKKRASGLTTSALGSGSKTKRGTLAVTSLAATPSRSTTSSATAAQSTETSSSSSVRDGKRKAIIIDSDDDEDFSAPRPSKPTKRARTISVASSSAVPSTQDVAYYDLSTENIITGSRTSRNRRAPTVETSSSTTPARSSRQQPITINDDADAEDEVIAAPRPSTRSNNLKRARIIDDDEDEDTSTTAPQSKRPKISDEQPTSDVQPTSDAQPKPKRMSSFDPVNKYSKKDNRLLDRTKKSDYIEYINSTLHYTRNISPEPAPTSKAYWLKILRDREARLAKEREEAERQRQAELEEEEEDEDPVVTAADRAKKSREFRRQNAAIDTSSTTKSPSPDKPSSPVKPSSTTKPSSITRSSSPVKPSSTTRPSSTTATSSTARPSAPLNFFSSADPRSNSILESMARPRIYTRPASSVYGRPSSTNNPSSLTRPSSSTSSSLTGSLLGSSISDSSTGPSSTTTSSSSSINNDHNTTQPEPRRYRPSSSSSTSTGIFGSRRFGTFMLSPITEQPEQSINEYDNDDEEDNDYHNNRRPASSANADQIDADEEMARRLHEEMNGAPPRVRRGRGFR